MILRKSQQQNHENKIQEHVVSERENLQKQSSRGVLKKRCSKNIHQIYRKTPMPKWNFCKVVCSFIEITLRHGCSPVNLLYIFRTPFLKNTSRRLLLNLRNYCYSKYITNYIKTYILYSAYFHCL